MTESSKCTPTPVRPNWAPLSHNRIGHSRFSAGNCPRTAGHSRNTKGVQRDAVIYTNHQNLMCNALGLTSDQVY
ncbi:hypothetical protein ACHAXH_000142 [Discostella pseudostelligera]